MGGLDSPKAQKLAARLPEGVSFSDAQKDILAANEALVDNAVSAMQDTIEQHFSDQLQAVVATSDRRTDEMNSSTDALHRKTEVLAKQMDGLKANVQRGFAALSAKLDELADA